MKSRYVRAMWFTPIALLASFGADAGIRFTVDLNPFGWGAAPPPVV